MTNLGADPPDPSLLAQNYDETAEDDDDEARIGGTPTRRPKSGDAHPMRH
jgi:hypothetical protein